MKLRDTKLLLIYLAVLTFSISNATVSAVELRIITDNDLTPGLNPFVGSITGAFFGPEDPPSSGSFPITSVSDFLNSGNINAVTEPGDIFWGNGDVLDTGGFITNSIGTSSISLGFNLDDMGEEQLFFQSFSTGTNTYASPIVFGENPVTFIRNGENTNGLDMMNNPLPPIPFAELTGTGINTFNSNNTVSLSNFIGSSTDLMNETFPIEGYYITRDQVADIETIFSEEFFTNTMPNRLITRDGLLAHFNFIIDNIQTDDEGNEWTLLVYDLSQSNGTLTTDGSAFTQVNFGATFVSYDQGAIPTPLPAAVWLFGTGFLSMFAFARRKTKFA